MRTHSISNKNGQNPIIKLTPKFLERVLKSEPEAICLALAWLKQRYKDLSGKEARLDHDQVLVLNQHYGCTPNGQWTSKFSTLAGTDYRILTIFETGFLASTGFDFEKALDTADRFYATIASALDGAPR